MPLSLGLAGILLLLLLLVVLGWLLLRRQRESPPSPAERTHHAASLSEQVLHGKREQLLQRQAPQEGRAPLAEAAVAHALRVEGLALRTEGSSCGRGRWSGA